LSGEETFDLHGADDPTASELTITARRDSGESVEFKARVRIDTPKEREYFLNGGILHYVLRQLASKAVAA